MKLMEKRAEQFLNNFLPDHEDWKYSETKDILKKLYLRMFYYDISEEETKKWIIDLYNYLRREFED